MRRGALARRLRLALLASTLAVASAIALLVTAGVAGDRAELATVDARFSIRGESPARDLVVVAIDDVTFDELPRDQSRFPFDRHLFAEVLEVVSGARPRAIVYDVQFTEPQGDSDEDIEADNALVEAARKARGVVFSTTEVDEAGGTNVFGGAEFQQYARVLVGSGLLPEGPGGAVRRLPYAVDGLPTLAVRTVQRLDRPIRRLDFEPGGAWIDFHGEPGHVRSVSFSRVLEKRVPPETFRDRIVVIGATAPVLQDRHATSAGGGSMAGPEIHANAISTLLRGMPLRSSAGWVDLLLAVLLSVAVPLIGLRARPLVALGAALVLAVAYAAAVQLAFQGGRVVELVGPLVGLALGAGGTLVALLLTATVEKAQMRDLFARFVPDPVVDQVLARTAGGDPRLGGVRLVSTVMFSDLRGFTTFAEGREPELVIEVLNRYLTLMSDAILDHGGTLVAYMGDGIMAVFGAPIGSDDHADRALAAAREMLARLEEFNGWMREQGHGDGFRTGIGLNSGEVMSGNVGSDRRLEYTAIGDTTNTAARLEAMTKDSPYQLYVATSTYERLSAPPADLEFAGELDVRGRAGKLRVWGLAEPPRNT